MRYAGSGIATTALLVGSLTACTSPFEPDEPDLPSPEAAVDRLAAGLTEGDLSEVVVHRRDRPRTPRDFASVVELMGSTEYVVTRRGRRGRRGIRRRPGDVDRHPHLDLGRRRHRRPGAGLDLRDAGRPHPGRRHLAGRLGAGAGRAVAERGAVLDVTTIARGPRGHHRRPWRRADRTRGRSPASASTRRGCRSSGRSGRPASWPRCSDIDAAAYAKEVEAAGEKAFVEALVLRREDVPVRVAAGLPRHPRRRRARGGPPPRPDARLRRAAARPGRGR